MASCATTVCFTGSGTVVRLSQIRSMKLIKLSGTVLVLFVVMLMTL